MCLAALKSLIPEGSVVSTYGFYSGEIELNLCVSNRFVNAHTTSYQVYEFWKCIEEDAGRVHDIVISDPFKFEPEMFSLLQEKWHSYRDPYVRAALFFLLNRCSESGLISSGELNTANFNPVSISYLKYFKPLDTLHVTHKKISDLSLMIGDTTADYIFIPCYNFSYNLFERGRSRGMEETVVNHRHLRSALRGLDNRWVLVYNYHGALRSFFNKEHLIMVDEYGRLVGDEEKCKEVLVCNFPSANAVV